MNHFLHISIFAFLLLFHRKVDAQNQLEKYLQSEAINIPGGSVTAGTKTFNVKTSGKFKSVEDIANTVIFNGNGKIIFLKDIATIDFKNEEEKHITRINGRRCVLVSAAQKVGANISTTQSNYLPIVAEYEKSLPENIKLIKNFDQAENVAQRLSGLGIDFLIAILLVLVTLLPLGFRASVIVMIAIPLSIALGLVGLNAFGFSLNQLSIVGLVVALGLLVDDCFVIPNSRASLHFGWVIGSQCFLESFRNNRFQ